MRIAAKNKKQKQKARLSKPIKRISYFWEKTMNRFYRDQNQIYLFIL